MAAKAEVLGGPVQPDGVWLYPDLHQGPAFTEPGIVSHGHNGTTSLLAVKHRQFRPGGFVDVPGTHEADVIPLVRPGAVTALGDDRTMGVEAELNVVDPYGDPASIYGDSSHSWIPGAHPELWANTLEVDAAPEQSAAGAYDELGRVIKAARMALLSNGLYLDPASARMQDEPGMKDVSPNPYVHAMVEQLGSRILQFVGTGIHEHYDLHIELSPIVSRYMRVLAPYLNLGLLAAPFGFGEHTPRMGEVLDNDELRSRDGEPILSLRYLTRFAASKNGGIGERVVHDTLAEALRHADSKLRDGSISNPSRHLGPHADVRNRYDAPSNERIQHPGRLELCVKDTAGLRFETLIAYAELTRAVLNQLEQVASGSEEDIHHLHKAFPNLFGSSYDADAFAKVQLERAHQNSIAIAYDGADAMVWSGTGVLVPARTMFEELIRFAQAGKNALALETQRTLLRSVATPEAVERIAQEYKNSATDRPSVLGYYQTGVGTFAHWMRLHEKSYRSAKPFALDKEIMREGTLDRVRSFGAYLVSRTKKKGARSHAPVTVE